MQLLKQAAPKNLGAMSDRGTSEFNQAGNFSFTKQRLSEQQAIEPREGFELPSGQILVRPQKAIMHKGKRTSVAPKKSGLGDLTDILSSIGTQVSNAVSDTLSIETAKALNPQPQAAAPSAQATAATTGKILGMPYMTAALVALSGLLAFRFLRK